MKTSELTGAALDWAVAKCEGAYSITIDTDIDGTKRINYGGMYPEWATDWAQGGPIIEREKLTLMYDSDWKYDPTDPEDNGERWMADNGDLYYNPNQYGATPLIAAMRFYVASKLGDEIELPKELT